MIIGRFVINISLTLKNSLSRLLNKDQWAWFNLLRQVFFSYFFRENIINDRRHLTRYLIYKHKKNLFDSFTSLVCLDFVWNNFYFVIFGR